MWFLAPAARCVGMRKVNISLTALFEPDVDVTNIWLALRPCPSCNGEKPKQQDATKHHGHTLYVMVVFSLSGQPPN